MAATVIDFERYQHILLAQQQGLKASAITESGWVDGLYYCLYLPAQPARELVILYHGGGVHQNAGYQVLAGQLAINEAIAVCLVDIRGHGQSQGEPGHVKNSSQIWQDVDQLLAVMHQRLPQARLHLLGHSSGAGMLLNYFTCYQPQQTVSSLMMLAPALGPFAPITAPNNQPSSFAQAKQWPFILHALTGGRCFGQTRAISLNFPEGIAQQQGFVEKYTVNMANALTPRQPAKQLAKLCLPTWVWVAAEDELFSAPQMTAFLRGQKTDNLHWSTLEATTHLDIIFSVSRQVSTVIAGL